MSIPISHSNSSESSSTANANTLTDSHNDLINVLGKRGPGEDWRQSFHALKSRKHQEDSLLQEEPPSPPPEPSRRPRILRLFAERAMERQSKNRQRDVEASDQTPIAKDVDMVEAPENPSSIVDNVRTVWKQITGMGQSSTNNAPNAPPQTIKDATQIPAMSGGETRSTPSTLQELLQPSAQQTASTADNAVIAMTSEIQSSTHRDILMPDFHITTSTSTGRPAEANSTTSVPVPDSSQQVTPQDNHQRQAIGQRDNRSRPSLPRTPSHIQMQDILYGAPPAVSVNNTGKLKEPAASSLSDPSSQVRQVGVRFASHASVVNGAFTSLQPVQQQQTERAGRIAQPSALYGNSLEAADTNMWVIQPEAKRQFIGYFEKLGAKNGTINMGQAWKYLSESRLSSELLLQICGLADTQNCNTLDSDDFCIAVHLANLLSSGRLKTVPTTLPPVIVRAENWFKSLDFEKTGLVRKDTLISNLLSSNVPLSVVTRVANLVNLKKQETLDCESIILTLHLIEEASTGKPLPETLPTSLIPPSHRPTQNPANTRFATSSNTLTQRNSFSGTVVEPSSFTFQPSTSTIPNPLSYQQGHPVQADAHVPSANQGWDTLLAEIGQERARRDKEKVLVDNLPVGGSLIACESLADSSVYIHLQPLSSSWPHQGNIPHNTDTHDEASGALGAMFGSLSRNFAVVTHTLKSGIEQNAEEMKQLRLEIRAQRQAASQGQSASFPATSQSGAHISGSRRNTPKKPIPIDPYSKEPEHVNFRQKIKRHLLHLLKIEGYPHLRRIHPPPTDQENELYEIHAPGRILVSPETFRIDLSRSRNSPFNRHCINVFAKHFRHSVVTDRWYSYPQIPEKYLPIEYIELSLYLHLKHVKGEYRAFVTHPSISKRLQQLQNSSRSTRKTRLFNARLKVVLQESYMAHHIDLMKNMGSQAVSSDESEPEGPDDQDDPHAEEASVHSHKSFVRITPAWRSDDLSRFMHNLDTVIQRRREPRIGHRAIRGQQPRHRKHSDMVNLKSVAPPGLPCNCYKPEWLASLDNEEIKKLEMKEQHHVFRVGTDQPVATSNFTTQHTGMPPPVQSVAAGSTHADCAQFSFGVLPSDLAAPASVSSSRPIHKLTSRRQLSKTPFLFSFPETDPVQSHVEYPTSFPFSDSNLGHESMQETVPPLSDQGVDGSLLMESAAHLTPTPQSIPPSPKKLSPLSSQHTPCDSSNLAGATQETLETNSPTPTLANFTVSTEVTEQPVQFFRSPILLASQEPGGMSESVLWREDSETRQQSVDTTDDDTEDFTEALYDVVDNSDDEGDL
ncbi:hypothetical protein SERLADRAFT_437514 [Serpula lacrymans var. lacrymans S7.9]|uniref:EH domain-containing protein n=1 Tax=Serpula lacrymans var. lacrymans (strain S7.9) TaxID=578457 RepID=F8NTW0_SERL9|nr:uncharacterized protein SERLADRAFT_437514 [Serpula lacrymans var. lacrymans S7.9]EGO25780.1 hypothetical protein SERLADRAFT_437514 [Serpula lacrymans var. lacrymans S7.9]